MSVIGQTTPFSVPDEGTFIVPEEVSYLYYCQNETVHGLEFNYVPKAPAGAALVSDISSNFMTRPVDFTKHDLVFAGAQKNFGPAGLTVVIIRKSLLGKALSICPTMLDYAVHAKAGSMYNTPPCFSIYMAGLMFEWVEQNGGVAAMEKRNHDRAAKLYEYIDNSAVFNNPVRACDRSITNVTFTLPTQEDTDAFLKMAKGRGMINLKGHRSVGGCRASMYNGLPDAACETLIACMKDFEAGKRE